MIIVNILFSKTQHPELHEFIVVLVNLLNEKCPKYTI